MKRNRIDDVTFPSSKVFLWERFDTTKSKRTSTRFAQTFAMKAPPAWNNPQAEPNVALVEGSITRVKTATLVELAADPKTQLDFRPKGSWNPPLKTLADYDMGADALENGAARPRGTRGPRMGRRRLGVVAHSAGRQA